jgi:hypothetical protein
MPCGGFPGTRVETTSFTHDCVQLHVTLPRDRAEAFIRVVADISRGQVVVELAGE